VKGENVGQKESGSMSAINTFKFDVVSTVLQTNRIKNGLRIAKKVIGTGLEIDTS
jgi:hydroxyethylthiazole kinase-like sugar kinase family protein